MGDRQTLLKALEARLADRQRACDAACDDWWRASTEDAMAVAMVGWEAARVRFEITRKALIRTRDGMPYWRSAKLHHQRMLAEGYEFMPCGAVRLPARSLVA